MGTGEETASGKPNKSAASTQEVPTTPVYPDWSSSMQAYYGAGGTAPPFFASTVASPAPHPYMWGGQHPLIPPYGTPVPYPAIYPPGGVYAHPTMGTTATVSVPNTELEGKGADGKVSAKKSKGASASTAGKAGESGKAASGSGNDGPSQSVDSSEGSSEGSEDNENQQESGASKKGSFDQMLADGANAQNNVAGAMGPITVPATPPTNLKIGMDVWNTSAATSGTATLRPNPAGAVPGTMTQDQWIQDERELKRQKRKQSNRESARRSRLRKQAECEELQRRVEGLTNENNILKEELQRLREECNKLASDNSSIKEELTQLCGPDAVAKIEGNSPSTGHQPQNGEGTS